MAYRNLFKKAGYPRQRFGEMFPHWATMRKERLESLRLSGDEIFQRLHSLEMDGLFSEAREASLDNIKSRKQELDYRLKDAMSALKELNQLFMDAVAGQSDDFYEGNAIAAEALRKRFKTGPFEFLARLTR